MRNAHQIPFVGNEGNTSEINSHFELYDKLVKVQHF